MLIDAVGADDIVVLDQGKSSSEAGHEDWLAKKSARARPGTGVNG